MNDGILKLRSMVLETTRMGRLVVFIEIGRVCKRNRQTDKQYISDRNQERGLLKHFNLKFYSMRVSIMFLFEDPN